MDFWLLTESAILCLGSLAGVNLRDFASRGATTASDHISAATGIVGLSRFKLVENANYAVVLCKEMGFNMVNVGGLDLVDGNKKIVLGMGRYL